VIAVPAWTAGSLGNKLAGKIVVDPSNPIAPSAESIFSLARFSCGFHVDTITVIYVHRGIAISTCFGGERGIRTLEGLLTLTPLAGVRLRPLGHLSAARKMLQFVARLLPRTAQGAAIILKAVHGRQNPAGRKALTS
jgi:hypothetical protein